MRDLPREGESLSPHAHKGDYKIEDRGYETPCWIWQKFLLRGYGTGAFKGAGIDTQHAHRAYYIAANGPIPAGVSEGVVDHLCRVPACVNPEHLEYVPARTNVRRGNLVRFTDEQMEAIKARLATVESMRVIAADYDVHENTIWHIAAGWTWNEDGAWGPGGTPIRPVVHCRECGGLITTGHRDKKYCCKEHRMRYVGRRTWRRKHWGSPDAAERPA